MRTQARKSPALQFDSSLMKIIFGLFFVLIFCTSVFAWDDAGHKISTEIAWRNMTPAAREKAIALLLTAPENSGILNLLAFDSRSLATRQEQMFYTTATWADLIRDKNFPVRNKEFHHGSWHYMDTFWRDANGRVEIVTDLKPDEQNAVERLFALEKTLRDPMQANAERAVALAWILHLAGDIHQPLHCSGRVTTLEPTGDQGGNLFLITPVDAQKSDNLHWYWDSILTRSTPRINDEADSTYIARLASGLTKKHLAKEFADKLKSGKYDQWQQEGFEFATKEVYPASLKRNEMPSENYRKRAAAIAEQRLALAGYRMADLFNQIFGS